MWPPLKNLWFLLFYVLQNIFSIPDSYYFFPYAKMHISYLHLLGKNR